MTQHKFQAGDVLKDKGRSGFEHHRFEVLEVRETDEEYLIRDVTPESENWKAVVGYEGLYEVSDQGRVRSLARPGVRKTRVLKTAPNTTGYPSVCLSKNRKRRTRQVHSMVMESFVGPRPSDMEVCHANHDKGDARLSNLRYDTHLANMNDPGTANTNGGKGHKTRRSRGHKTR